MIVLNAFRPNFEKYLKATALKLTKDSRIPTAIGLTIYPNYGYFGHSLHFGTIDPRREIAIPDYDLFDFSVLNIPEWEETSRNDQKVQTGDGETLTLTDGGDEEYARPFVDFFVPLFNNFWRSAASADGVDWLAFEVVGMDPSALWRRGNEVPDLYPTSIFTPGPPLKNQKH